MTFGLNQIELGIPVLLRARLGISPTVIGLLSALGTVVVVAAQLPSTGARWICRRMASSPPQVPPPPIRGTCSRRILADLANTMITPTNRYAL